MARRRMVHNVFLNLAGQGVPFVAAIFAIPFLIKGLGPDRFGILTLAWLVIGYFSFFDFGLGRAMTKLMAEKIGSRLEGEIPGIFWTALAIMLVTGVIGAVFMIAICPWLNSILKVPLSLHSETQGVFYLLAFSIPVAIASSGLRGALQAYHYFGVINAVRIPVGMFMYLGPVCVLRFSHNLLFVAALLVIGSIFEALVLFVCCLKKISVLRAGFVFQREVIRGLVFLGGWISVTNIVGPLLIYLDRFLIGALISVSAVAYYATPYSIVMKLTVISSAVVGVMFPTFATGLMSNRHDVIRLFHRGNKYIFLVFFPTVFMIIAFAYEGLDVWIGRQFADNSVHVLQWLAVGVFVNGLTQLSVALVEGNGRPDLIARLHLIELPPYLIALWWLLKHYGINGAAVAWVLRVVLDMIVQLNMAKWLLPDLARSVRHVFAMSFLSLIAFALDFAVGGTEYKVLFVSFILVLFMAGTWLLALDSEEKRKILNIKRIINSGQTG